MNTRGNLGAIGQIVASTVAIVVVVTKLQL